MVTSDLAPELPPAPPPIADGIERRLDPRVVQLDRIVGWIFTAAISLGSLVGVLIFILVTNFPGWLSALIGLGWIALAAALAWFSYRWPEVEHRHISYKADPQGIEIRKGVVWRSVIHVPRSRVQHTDVSQGPIERGFGLGTLVIYTAGTDHARVDLSGLEHGTALRIRDWLLPDDEDAG